jgi:uncharacterized protein (DUF488 family)
VTKTKPVQTIYTIGHSTTPEEKFIAWLQPHGIDVLLDVRSSPFSKHAPQFNRRALSNWLDAAQVKYFFGGKELGGRPSDRSLYQGGQVSYQRMSGTEGFRLALRRLVQMAKRHSVVLLCAEAEPLECHRFLLISRVLHAAGYSVKHILPGGTAEPHEASERRLVRIAGLSQPDFFAVTDDVLQRAYDFQAERFAFRGQPAMPELSWMEGAT